MICNRVLYNVSTKICVCMHVYMYIYTYNICICMCVSYIYISNIFGHMEDCNAIVSFCCETIEFLLI